MKRSQLWKSIKWLVTSLAILFVTTNLPVLFNGLVTLAGAFLLVICFLQVIVSLSFVDKAQEQLPKLGIRNFLIGDDGGYSLSRLQAAIWALSILSYQIAAMITLARKGHFSFFDLTFSEQSMWLLGLSLSTAVSVKAITSTTMQDAPGMYKKISNPRVSDIFVGENGLDLSKCQMFIWTLLGLVAFLYNCCDHLNALSAVTGELDTLAEKYQTLFTNKIDTGGMASRIQIKVAQNELPSIPYLPWSFIILMGLSQGAYVGRKLVPTHKLDAIRINKEEELKLLLDELDTKKSLLSNILTRTNTGYLHEVELKSKQALTNEIEKLKIESVRIQQDISEINQFQTRK